LPGVTINGITTGAIFWGDRFKSAIVDKGETLENCLAYIDLNPLSAGRVKRRERYRWFSLGYQIETDNKDDFLSTCFGMKEFNVTNEKERIRRYQRYGYQAAALNPTTRLIFQRPLISRDSAIIKPAIKYTNAFSKKTYFIKVFVNKYFA